MLYSIPVFLALLVPAPAAQPVEAAGKYTCKGRDADGREYEGTVEIRKNGDVYLVRWTVPNFGNYVGVGIRTDNLLSVSWVTNGAVGVMVYKLGEEKHAGRWAQLGPRGTVQEETLTPVKPAVQP